MARLQLLQQTFVSEITVNLINHNVEAKAIKIDSKGEMNHNHQATKVEVLYCTGKHEF